jgi:5-hydroxyisourate hydrolase-like protein (transthyretin family)
MWKNSFFFMCLMLVLVACRKKDLEFTFSGVITDSTFGVTASNVTVRLFTKPIGANEQFEKQLVTAADGKYELVIPRERIESVRLSFVKDNYFREDVVLQFATLQVNTPNQADVELVAKGWVKFVVKNDPPTAPDDEFKMLKYRGRSDCDDCCPNGFSYFYGSIDTSFVCVNSANDYISYYYWVVDTQINGQDSVYTTPFDTVVRTFIY